MKPKALDLFCKAGGASEGLHRAGFDVTGVDIEPQPNYPFAFFQADALDFPLDGYDLIWASPPCKAFTAARVLQPRRHADLLTPIRARLENGRTPWIIENVPGAPLRKDVVLCGSMFGDNRLIRHRWFELSCPGPALVPSCNHGSEIVSVFGHGGKVYHGMDTWRAIMGIDWMTRAELAQAIPPAYSEFLGSHMARLFRRLP